MKLSPFVIGVISAQSGGGDYDYSDDGDRGYYGGSDDSWSGLGSTNWNYGSSGRLSNIKATAVTCWESNNMGSHTTHHNHMYDMEDQYGWANTHYGHYALSSGDTRGGKGTVNVVRGTEMNSGTGTVDYHSALAFDHRLSGCIYEVAGWDFNANTYNKIHTMTYGTAGGTGTDVVGYDTTNGNIFPVWWHYFNAHTMAGGNTQTHKLIMANPTYEGLGYLNFIVTFLAGTNSGNGVDRDPHTNDNNLEDTKHTDLYSNGDVFNLALEDAAGCTAFGDLASGNTCFASAYAQSNTNTDNWVFTNMAISSFPHNDLGKDFRFNLRMMHHLGEGDSTEFFDSYYFYRVNTINMVFPHTVACPYEQQWDGAANAAIMHKCMDSADHNGHQMWYDDGSAHGAVAPMFVESLTDNLARSHGNVCNATPTLGYKRCGETYSVSGLMNMYDEYAQQEFGTHQEIWFQFCYMFEHDINDISDDANQVNTGVYNYPNKLFNAFEVVSASGSCDGTNVMTYNRCNGGDVGNTVDEETWSENVQSGR